MFTIIDRMTTSDPSSSRRGWGVDLDVNLSWLSVTLLVSGLLGLTGHLSMDSAISYTFVAVGGLHAIPCALYAIKRLIEMMCADHNDWI